MITIMYLQIKNMQVIMHQVALRRKGGNIFKLYIANEFFFTSMWSFVSQQSVLYLDMLLQRRERKDRTILSSGRESAHHQTQNLISSRLWAFWYFLGVCVWGGGVQWPPPEFITASSTFSLHWNYLKAFTHIQMG